jgi:hypothetical protein
MADSAAYTYDEFGNPVAPAADTSSSLSGWIDNLTQVAGAAAPIVGSLMTKPAAANQNQGTNQNPSGSTTAANSNLMTYALIGGGALVAIILAVVLLGRGK